MPPPFYGDVMANQFLPGVIQTPSTLLITAITRSFPMIVTFTVPSTGANTYIPGQLVRFQIPRNWGMQEINERSLEILAVDSTTMAIKIDSTNFDAFVNGSATKYGPASLSPAGSRNLQYNNTTEEVPFQSLNNQGN